MNKNVIQVYNDKNFEFHYQNLDNIVLKAYQSIVKFERYHLILKVSIPNL